MSQATLTRDYTPAGEIKKMLLHLLANNYEEIEPYVAEMNEIVRTYYSSETENARAD